MIVGLDGIDTFEAMDRLRQYTERLSAGTNVEWSKRDHAEIVREGLAAKRRFVEEFFAPSWARREALVAAWRSGRLDEASLPNDLLTLMLRNEEHFGKWDRDVVVREARLFTTAGAQTPTRAVAHVIAELGHWLEAHPEDRARIDSVDFLRAALAETLRLHPGSPKIRRAVRDLVMNSGRQVRAGEYFLLDPVAANRDPAVFGEDAARFRPDRAVRGAPAYGFAFGGGPHTCIGKGLSIGEAPAAEDATMGLVVRVLRELYRAGVALDPDHPPRQRKDVISDEYETFPVRFDRLA
jgi:cytochrome P450